MSGAAEPQPSLGEETTFERPIAKSASPGSKRMSDATPDITSSHERGADAESGEVPKKRRKLRHNPAGGDLADEEDAVQPSDREEDNPSAGSDADDAPPVVSWNAGITRGGLRTSFGAPAPKQASGPLQGGHDAVTSLGALPMAPNVTNAMGPLPNATQDQTEEKPVETLPASTKTLSEGKEARRSDNGPERQAKSSADTFFYNNVTWRLRSLSSEGLQESGSTWRRAFEKWCRQFIAQNSSQIKAIADDVVVAAYLYFLRGLGETQPKRLKAANKAASKFIKQGKLQELLSNPGPQPADEPVVLPRASKQNSGRRPDEPRRGHGEAAEQPPEPATAEGQDKLAERRLSDPNAQDWVTVLDTAVDQQGGRPLNVPNGKLETSQAELSLDEQEYLGRYFPGIGGESLCLVCACSGHSASQCPHLICDFCGEDEHMSFSCPKRTRCTKCRQLGHLRETCQEKLKLAPGEDDECAFCQSKFHHDETCEWIWRSFDPEQNDRREVKDTPSFCHRCGHAGHYGPECSLVTANYSRSGHETWSTYVRDGYVNPNSEDFAIGWDPQTILPVVNLGLSLRPNIPGKTIVPQRHAHLPDVESEGEDGFARPHARPAQPKGSIRINASIGAATSRTTGHENDMSMAGGVTGDSRGSRFNPPLPPGPPPPGPPPNGPSGLPARPQASYGRPYRPYASGSRGGPNNHNAPRDQPSRGGRGSHRGPRGDRGRGGFRGGRGR